MNVKKVVIFASGSGTNAENIIKYFADNELIKIDSLWSNTPNAYALKRAEMRNIETFVFNREEFYNSEKLLGKLKKRNVDVIVLAGFLWLVPGYLIRNFTIVNIHPALLPKYGGKGMYGMNIHKAVIDNEETETGISIHYVNEKYDEGQIIFQIKCEVSGNDTPESVAKKVHDLEYKYFPSVIENILMKKD
ncbi:MAG: phosphoribosylglycinamide formyltransferase [Bacteroidales bacterium]|jgi:phosphoribosylglycinamide formyltransferase-1|nr:phosphoribosylglycinamide formyltransferase [Bacteroidales bacterium]